MTRLAAADCERLLTQLRDLVTLLERDLERARVKADEYHHDGFASSEGGRQTPGSVSRPTEALALRDRHDPTTGYRSTLHNRVRNLSSAAADMTQTVTTIVARAGSDSLEDGTRRTSLGSGHCRACDRYAPGTADDRLRGGLCDPCRQRFRRSPEVWGHDPVRFARETRTKAVSPSGDTETAGH